MKKLAILGVLILVAVTLAITIPAQAAVTYNGWDTLPGQTQSPCTGNYIDWVVTIHTVNTVTTDASGGYHWISRANVQATGTDEETGDVYNGWGTVTTISNTSSASTYTWIDLSRTKSKGLVSNDKATLYLRAVYIINAEGEVTANWTIDGSDCKYIP